MPLQSSYLTLPERFYVSASPARVPAPRLLAWNRALAEELSLHDPDMSDDDLARLYSGNELPDGAEPVALAYAGHQFGQFVPQLGDGRAVLLGDVRDSHGQRVDIQLKGSGRTAFSRGGDGKSSLGPVIREYVLSEAMHHLGVPTTRALAAVATGEQVQREQALPGGVLTRVAASHIRIGTFEYFAARNDIDALKELADFAIQRHYPGVAGHASPYRAFFAEVVQAQATLVAHWMAIGFIHGVMNTDNTTVSGQTLDYGPCAFMDEFNPNKVFSSIDRHGRYAYAQQAPIAHWNLSRLAGCLLTLDEDLAAFEQELEKFPDLFSTAYLGHMRRKLGLVTDESADSDLVTLFLGRLESGALDYSISFRQLAQRVDATDTEQFGDFETAWRLRLARQDTDAETTKALMNATNPALIPRNHQVERAIQAAIADDMAPFEELNAALAAPYDESPRFAHLALAPAPQERVTQTFCGT